MRLVLASLWMGISAAALAAVPAPVFQDLSPGVAYANVRVPSEPWSIHVVRVDRSQPDLTWHTTHASGKAIGLAPLSEQVKSIAPDLGRGVAAVNGDFYQRERALAGDPRGLQISEGQLLSAPAGGVAFWVDAKGQPSMGMVTSHFELTWPDGAVVPFGLNQERLTNLVVLYTPSLGTSTRTEGGRELVLEPQPPGRIEGLRAGETVRAVVREVREVGDTALSTNRWVLSLDPKAAPLAPRIAVGDVLKLSANTTPALQEATAAISGGPMLVQGGKRQGIKKPASESYEFSSMLERHPRSALGWNAKYLFLVVVDGRQKELSVGMTLEELGDYLRKLGCDEAMNLDGGGSATLWCEGQVRNKPCDGRERPIANALVLVRRPQR